MSEPLVIIFPIYQGVTQLDFTGPLQFLRHMPGAEIIVASVDGADVESEGLHFTQLRPLPEIARCDVLCVPGGSGCTQALQDEAFMRQIRRLGADARYLTSVCTGSLILAAAGFAAGQTRRLPLVDARQPEAVRRHTQRCTRRARRQRDQRRRRHRRHRLSRWR